MISNSILYFSDDDNKRYYFLIPDDIDLMPGDFEISTLLGHKQYVNPDVLPPFEVSREEAEEILSQKMKTGIERTTNAIKNAFQNIIEAGNTKPDESRPKITFNLLAQLMDVPVEELKSNPEARKQGWSNLFDYVTNVVVYSMSDNPEHRQQAKNEMQWAEQLMDSYGIDTKGFLRKTPDQIRDLYLSSRQAKRESEE